MALLTFIFTIVGISLSGVMAPGPITAATLAAGERNRHAGAWICIGHIAVELPLILLLAAGLGTFLESKGIVRESGWSVACCCCLWACNSWQACESQETDRWPRSNAILFGSASS